MDTLTFAATIGAALAVVALIAAVAALRRAGSRAEWELLQRQIPAAMDSLRIDVRTGLDGATQTLNQRIAQLGSEVDQRLAEIGGEVARKLESTTGMIGQRLDGASRAVADVHQRLGSVQSATERVLEVGKDIASLQQILRAPKLRGGLGELILGEILAQTLPPASFELQHVFLGGQRVDAVVKVGDRMVPVDAKFPLENFMRMVSASEDAARAAARRAFIADVKKRIDEIAGRYILPEEGTFDFALMYVPAENIYYETIVRDENGQGGLYEYSLARRVVPVSPNTLYSYLQVIILGLRGFRIEQRAQEILGALGGLRGELDRFGAEFSTLGRHIDDAQRKFGDGVRRLHRLRDSVGRLESLEEGEDHAEAALEADGDDPLARGPGD